MNLRNLFANSNQVQAFQAGSTIFAEGTAGEVMYVVLEGEVEVQMGSAVVEVVGPGDIVGEMALIDGQARSATTVAKSACRLARVDEQRFHFMVQETPFFALNVMRVLTARLRRMDAEWKANNGREPTC
jgi:CRP/FNR family cyclic AMP-dependent transcriptional regulator